MLVQLTQNGKWIDGPETMRDGLNVFGRIRGKVNPQTLEVTPWAPEPECLRDAEDRDAFYTHGDAALWRFHGGSLVYAAPDLAGVRDVFHARTGSGGWALSDDFFEIARLISSPTPDRAAIDYFIRHGYFSGGATFLEEVRRVPTGTRFTLREGRPVFVNLFTDVFSESRGIRREFSGFQRMFESVVETEGSGVRDGVLLSGGWDSGLIAAAIARSGGDMPSAVTFAYAPESDGSRNDVHVARILAEMLGMAHHVESVDLSDLPLEPLDALVERMPLAAHLGLGILAGTRRLPGKGVDRVWCGQNADSIYNLGPTSLLKKGQGKVDLVKRFYLSKPFIDGLADVDARGGALSGALSRAGVRLSSLHFRGAPFRTPRTVGELLTAFRLSENYLSLLPPDHPLETPFPEKVSSARVREALFDEKLSSFLVGRDARVTHHGPGHWGIDSIRPFASPAMLLYFRGLEMTWRDVWSPKRFIRYALRDALGPRVYGRVYGRKASRPPNIGVSSSKWQSELMSRTRFAREMAEEIDTLPGEWRSRAEASSLQQRVSLYWLSRVMSRLFQDG